MKITQVLILFLSLSIISCKKGKADFTIKGTVQDVAFNQGLKSTSISIYQLPIGESVEKLLATTTTDDNGFYTFTFQREPTEKYILRIEKLNYFEFEKDIQFSSLTVENDNVRDFDIYAKSWVKIRIRKTSTSGEPQSIRYIQQEGKKNCPECCPNTEQNYEKVSDTSIFCINNGNTNYSIYYWLSGSSDQGLKSVYTTPFDTTELLITY